MHLKNLAGELLLVAEKKNCLFKATNQPNFLTLASTKLHNFYLYIINLFKATNQPNFQVSCRSTGSP